MNVLAQDYAQAVRDIASKIAATQMAAIERAADAISSALANRGAFWVHRIGHGGEQDLRGRAGGLMATRVLSLNLNASSPAAGSPRGKPRPEPVDADLEQMRQAARASEMRSGDVLMLASVSGRTRSTVELALAAGGLGVTVIGLTSLEYTAQVESDHPSGKKLCDVADIVIDNCAPFGDACLQAEGYDHKVLPISGIAHTIISWMICGQVIEQMRDMGKQPHVYMSINRPGGREHNERAMREYSEVGF
jgi:uncharacterized phosphosugar-binding protein